MEDLFRKRKERITYQSLKDATEAFENFAKVLKSNGIDDQPEPIAITEYTVETVEDENAEES